MGIIKNAREKLRYFISLPFKQKTSLVEGLIDGFTTGKPVSEEGSDELSGDRYDQYLIGYGYGTAVQTVGALGILGYAFGKGHLMSLFL